MICKQQKPNLTVRAQVKLGAEKLICLVNRVIKRGPVERRKMDPYYAFFLQSAYYHL